MLKDMQESEQLADVIAERMNKAPAEPAQDPGLLQAQPPQEQRKAPSDDEEIVRDLSQFDRQRLLNSKPKSVTDRMMQDILLRQQGANKRG